MAKHRNAEKARLTVNRARAVELRKSGATYQEIAADLGCSLSTAHGYVKAELEAVAKVATEDASEVLAVELARLDAGVAQTMKILQAPDTDDEVRLKAVDRLVKLTQARSKLLGIEPPQKHAVEFHALPLDQIIARIYGTDDKPR